MKTIFRMRECQMMCKRARMAAEREGRTEDAAKWLELEKRASYKTNLKK